MAYCNNRGSGWGNGCGAATCASAGSGAAGASCGNGCGTAACGSGNMTGSCDGGGFSCVINLIIILIVLLFLTQLICGLNCE